MFVKTVYDNGVVAFSSDNITTPHMFSTRCAGVSSLPHLVSLNLGENRGDSPENVRTNFERFLSVKGLSYSSLIRARQIHSTNVRIVDDRDAGKVFDDCDGFVSKSLGVVLCVKVADCAPILLYDEKNRVIGALHAGWRGASRGIAENGVKQMISCGADVKNIKAAIGACIHPCCYEVGKDFFDEVASYMGSECASRYVKKAGEEKFRADIVGMNIYYLKKSGIEESSISVCKECTCCHPELFFSHRYGKGMRGTMCAVISL